VSRGGEIYDSRCAVEQEAVRPARMWWRAGWGASSRLDSEKKGTETTMKMRTGEGELRADSVLGLISGLGLRLGAHEAQRLFVDTAFLVPDTSPTGRFLFFVRCVRYGLDAHSCNIMI
jgi:hypothetical protein